MISAVVLAAGSSTRFGRTKQIVEHRGKPLAQHAVDAAVGAGVDEIVVVLGHDTGPVLAALALPSTARHVTNERHAQGQSTSLAVGLSATSPDCEAAVVLLADQPDLAPEDVRALVDAFRTGRARIVRLRYRDAPGPALLSREIFSEAAHLSGDMGARALIEAHPDWVEEVRVDRDAPPDVDEPDDLGGASRR